MSSTGARSAKDAKAGTAKEDAAVQAEADVAAADGGESEDVRAKFRAALERKQHQHAAGTADGEGKESKVHQAHGPAASRRSFRRKSG